MRKYTKRITLLLLVLMMVLASCNGAATPAATIAATAATAVTTTAATAPTAPSEPEGLYPYKDAPALKWWTLLDSKVSKIATGLNETAFAKDLIEQTGIKVEFIQPAIGQDTEQFNLMIAGGDLADIVEYRWLDKYPGGPEMAFKQNHMLKLNDYMEEYAPDFLSYLNANPSVDKMVKTDAGDYYGFPFVRGDISICVFQGPIVRGDWLEELNIPVPETIDEWTEMLRRFKNEKGATAAFQGENGSLSAAGQNPFKRGAFVGAYGAAMDFYLDPATDTFRYGPLEPGFKDFVVQMNAWYKEGLMDQSFMTDLRKDLDANMLSGATGATVGNAGGGIGTYDAAFKSAGLEIGRAHV